MSTKSYIIHNLDFILVVSFISFIFFWRNFLVLRKRWTQRNFKYFGILLLYVVMSWLGVSRIESYVSGLQIEKLLGYAPSYAIALERIGHSQINFDTSADDSLYLHIIEYEKAWQKANPFVADIYTLKKNKNGHTALLVDSETDYDKDGSYRGERESRTSIGEIFNKDIPSLRDAFMGHPGFTLEPYADRWGSWVSAFVPIRNSENQVDSVLAVDFPSEVYLSDIKNARYLVLGIITLFFLLFTNYVSAKYYHRQHRKNLDAALKKAKEATEVKSMFLANMSHEFRTPLNAILGMIHLLSYMKLNSEVKKKVNIIKICSDNLLTLINDILDFSKIEAGKLTLEFMEFELDTAIQEIVELFQPMVDEKGLKIFFEVKETAALVWISSDLTRIRQVLMNLITNAIKFTPQGKITVTLSGRNIQPDQCEIQISVADTGVGIDFDVQKKLFQSFSQADASITRRFGGTGLGLAISKGIVEAMGGKIWVESTLQKGSIFYFKFTAQKVLNSCHIGRDKTQGFDPGLANRKPLKILVVDDQMPNRLLASNFLSLLGYTAVTVCNGLEALDAFNTNFYDVVFMDCHMPEMDGFESTKKIKKRFSKEKSPWIIALTASAYPEDIEKCFKHGMDDFIAKPFSVAVLSRALEKIVTPLHVPSELSLQVSAADDRNALVDWNLMQKLFVCDKSVMYVVIENFIRIYPSELAQIQIAIEKEDFKKIHLSCHKLRGNVANFYAKAIQDNLLMLETRARHKDLSDSSMLFSKIKIQFEQLKIELEKITFSKVS